MNCEEARETLTAHLDGELDIASSGRMERHLAECAECRRVHEEGLVLREALRGQELYWEVPAGLAKKIRAGVKAEVRGTAWGWNWAWAVAGAAAMLVVALLWPRPGEDRVILAEVVASHVRSLQADHLLDVPSSDRHTVKPWFQGKLDYSPPVPDLADLVGGRLDYIGGRAVAALVYRRRAHRINVFVWPASAGGGMERKSVQGYQMVHWWAAGMEWWAVSDMNGEELQEFARAMERGN